MSKISFLVDHREVRDDGTVKIGVSLVNSTASSLETNELPKILNAIKQSEFLDPEANVGFTYTFPFSLVRGRGFPYVFDFEIEDDNMLTLT